MKKLLGDLLLVGGVIVASLAAGESRRVSRPAPVDAALIGEVLHTAARTSYEERDPGLLLLQDRELPAGVELGPADVEWLRLHGFEEVLVLRRRVTTETLPVDETLVGRVLATPVVLSEETEEIRPGRQISPSFVQRLEASGVNDAISIVATIANEEGTTHREKVAWSLVDPAANPAGVTLLGSNLAQAVELPVQLAAESYVDAEVLARLRASGVGEVEVKIPNVFRWQDWGLRWLFVAGVAITLGGVLLKRSRPDVAELEEGRKQVSRLGGTLSQLEGDVERLVGKADTLDAAALHAAIDPLLLGPVYDVAEGRETIRQGHGQRVFTLVMDPFARGERNLNRAWSAAVDGHAPEARASLVAALPSLREAREALPGAPPPAPAGFEDLDPGQPLPPDVPLAGGDPWHGDDA